jgi:hypothetical protein
MASASGLSIIRDTFKKKKKPFVKENALHRKKNGVAF